MADDTIPEIESSRFGGDEPLDVNEIKTLNINTFNEAGKLIANYADEPHFMVGLTLTPDNTAIENANSILIGKAFKKEFQMDGKAVWNFNHTANLIFRELDLNKFVFNDENYVQINECSMGTKCAPHTNSSTWAGLKISTSYLELGIMSFYM